MTSEVYNPWKLFDRPTSFQMDRDLEDPLGWEFSASGRNPEHIRELGQQIYQRYLVGLPYREAFQRALDIDLRINQIHFPAKKRAISRIDADVKLSSVAEHISEFVVMEQALSIPQSYLDQLYAQYEVLESRDGILDWDRWFYPKVGHLAIGVKTWQWAYPWIKQVSDRVGKAIQGQEGGIKEDADKVWEQVRQDKGYGIKTCFFQSPLFLDLNHAFYIADENMGINDPTIRSYFPVDIAAVLALGEKPRFHEDISPKLVKNEDGPVVKYHKVEFGNPHAIFAVSKGGDIRTSVQTYNPLRKAFEKHGTTEAYELFRLFMLMRLYDLTSRAETIDRMLPIEQVEREIARNREGLMGLIGLGKRVKPFDYKRLIVPRTKPIEPEMQINEQTTDEPRRFVDKYHVTWFTRRLPQGYHASEGAKQYAQEHDVTLQEDETIVREHDRGKGNFQPKRATEAKFRRQ